jgi:hypothetical protein
MNTTWLRFVAGCLLCSALVGCGGSASSDAPGSASSAQTQGQPQVQASVPASVPVLVSDASSSDWAMVGIKVLSVDLVPSSGGPSVRAYTAPTTVPYINLEQLDHIGELLGTATVPAGRYTSALVTVSANAGDVLLTSSENPQPQFPDSASSAISSANIQVQNVQTSNGTQTVPINVTLASPLTVSSSGTASGPVQLDFHLSQPSFLVGQKPSDANATLWAVDFQGPVTQDAIDNISSLVLRQFYGTLVSVSSDGRALTVTRDYPTEPAVNPETAVSTSQTLSILADTGNGTLFDDLDDGVHMTVTNYASLSGLSPARFLRVSARYQPNGSLVATHIWTGNDFQTVWSSPEGHVMQVNSANDTLTIEDESGHSQSVPINAQTEFSFQGTPIGTGPAFLASGAIVRGFKVHVSWANPNTPHPVAQSVDIETAAFTGAISASNASGFTYTSNFTPASDNYRQALYYIAASTPNGVDAAGNPINGYSYWNFAFPSELAYGSAAIGDFVASTSGSVTAYGASLATWNDPANPNGWAARTTVLLPVPLGLATVNTGLTVNGTSATFSVTPVGASAPITVQLFTVSGSAPLVYQIDRNDAPSGIGAGVNDHTNTGGKGNGNENGNDNGNGNAKGDGNPGKLTENPIDITTSSGLAQLQAALTPGTSVKVFGIPKTDGTLQAYTVFYYTGTQPIK